ncbi:hypothetical protein ACFL59_14445, partial [Planctomycetota bacterium]
LMEHVDSTQLEVSGRWLADAWHLRRAVEDKSAGKERKKEIARLWSKKSESAGWPSLKFALLGLGGQRCWYCESPFIRQRPQIDHFRPKSSAKGRDGTVRLADGYWWLAFEVSNFRISCELCNVLDSSNPDGETRGKGTYFPLMNESVLARPDGDLEEEKPLLVDPCQVGDSNLLDFDVQGQAGARDGATTEQRDRVSVSIIRLNLDDPSLTAYRAEVIGDTEMEVQRWCRGENRVRQAKDSQDALEGARDCAEALREIRRLLHSNAKYRGTVRRYLTRRLVSVPTLRGRVSGLLVA